MSLPGWCLGLQLGRKRDEHDVDALGDRAPHDRSEYLVELRVGQLMAANRGVEEAQEVQVAVQLLILPPGRLPPEVSPELVLMLTTTVPSTLTASNLRVAPPSSGRPFELKGSVFAIY